MSGVWIPVSETVSDVAMLPMLTPISVPPECMPIALQPNEISKGVSRVQSIEGGFFIPCVINSLNGEFSNLGFRVPKFSNFVLVANEPIWLAHPLKYNTEIMEALLNRSLYSQGKNIECLLHLWPTYIYTYIYIYIYIGEKSTALGRAYRRKVACHWKHLWEHIQYFTRGFENFLGTHWEQQSPQTIQLSSPPLPKREGEKKKKKP